METQNNFLKKEIKEIEHLVTELWENDDSAYANALRIKAFDRLLEHTLKNLDKV